ncbi:hypothetical protein [Elizabethkingia anophelis]|uniref:hypothetical protein n=1 Tax=Elizabethkingia anophelis TaxID=1117645 RepID=UPI002011F208|nr:hypothetical protein [Elizabethkingia anophelis]MCL1691961.1 hypothetical protein [Elizabethkingia anophelis]
MENKFITDNMSSFKGLNDEEIRFILVLHLSIMEKGMLLPAGMSFTERVNELFIYIKNGIPVKKTIL